MRAIGVPGAAATCGIHDPELDPVALAVEAHQVGAERGAAVEAELADALGDLGDEQVVAIELPRGEREIDAVVLEVDGEDAGADLAALRRPRRTAVRADRPAAPRPAEAGDGRERAAGGGERARVTGAPDRRDAAGGGDRAWRGKMGAAAETAVSGCECWGSAGSACQKAKGGRQKAGRVIGPCRRSSASASRTDRPAAVATSVGLWEPTARAARSLFAPASPDRRHRVALT